MGSITFKAPVPRPGGEYRKSIFVDTDEKEGVEYQLVFKIINTDPPQYKVKPIANYKSQNQLDGKLVNATRSLYVRAKDPSKRELLVEKLVAQQALKRKSVYKIQDECPFLPLDISPKLFHDWRGLRIYTCCELCLLKVKESPYHAIIKLAEKGQTPIDLSKD